MFHLPRLSSNAGSRVFKNKHRLIFMSVMCFLLANLCMSSVVAQSIRFERDRGRQMLSTIKSALKKNYYDPNFHGIDVDARFAAAEAEIKTATSINQIIGIIAQVLMELNDSHTRFIPPARAVAVEYGWRAQAIGDQCFVVAVKPGSDAAAKGLKPGDLVHAVDGVRLTRDDIKVFQYLYYALRPQTGMRLIVQSPGGEPRQLDVTAKVKQGKTILDFTGASGGNDIMDMIREAESESRLYRHVYFENMSDVFLWKMPRFDLDEPQIDEMMSKAKNRSAIVLDLRGNPGGREDTLLRLLGHFFDADVKIGDIQRRRESKPLVARTRGGNRVYKGKLIVLVDSQSASSAEIFARVIQLEKRGTVIGDKTAGAVMRSRGHSFQIGQDTVAFYGVSITDADLVMTDGKSLERNGVMPDELRLPGAFDLVAKRDPVLVHAFSLLGLRLTPEQAGALFPIEWSK